HVSGVEPEEIGGQTRDGCGSTQRDSFLDRHGAGGPRGFGPEECSPERAHLPIALHQWFRSRGDCPVSGFRFEQIRRTSNPLKDEKENPGMKMNFKVIEPNGGLQLEGGLYQEIAIYVRDLLRSDYGLVALLENDVVRIAGIAVRSGVACASLPA